MASVSYHGSVVLFKHSNVYEMNCFRNFLIIDILYIMNQPNIFALIGKNVLLNHVALHVVGFTTVNHLRCYCN